MSTHKFDGVAIPYNVDAFHLLQTVEALGIIKHFRDLNRLPWQRLDACHSLSGIVFLTLGAGTGRFEPLAVSFGPLPLFFDGHVASCWHGL
jgi:hypothetical protein